MIPFYVIGDFDVMPSRVVLIRPPALKIDDRALFLPTNLAILSGALENNGIDSIIVDFELASILAMKPRIVLLDEPDSGIDVESLDRIFEALMFFKAAGSTVIMITHSPTVLRHAEHAFLRCCGKILSKGTVDSLTPFVNDKCVPCNHVNKPSPTEVGEIGT